MRTFSSTRGVGLIEVVIGIGIFVLIIVSLLGTYRFLVRFSGTTSQTVKANYLLEEGLEVARVLRDANWDTFAGLTSGTPYYLTLSGSTWSTNATPSVIDGTYYRSITIHDVYRDGNHDIASSGTLDPDTYLVTATIAWSRAGATTTKTMSTYLANLFE
jgi:Tfp pilus assembly protein PilV